MSRGLPCSSYEWLATAKAGNVKISKSRREATNAKCNARKLGGREIDTLFWRKINNTNLVQPVTTKKESSEQRIIIIMVNALFSGTVSVWGMKTAWIEQCKRETLEDTYLWLYDAVYLARREDTEQGDALLLIMICHDSKKEFWKSFPFVITSAARFREVQATIREILSLWLAGSYCFDKKISSTKSCRPW